MQKLKSDFFCPICNGIDEETISKIFSVANRVSFPSGSFIYNQDDISQGFYIVLKGNVRLSSQNEDGKEFLVKRLSSGDVFGEAAILKGSCFESSYAETNVECVFVPKKDFLNILKGDLELSLSVIESAANWVCDFYSRLKMFSLTNVRDRVERYFQLESQKAEGGQLSLELKKHEIASNLGMRPETFSRVLGELQSEGLIAVKNNIVDLSNIKTLTQ